jgi:hypothetical protein
MSEYELINSVGREVDISEAITLIAFVILYWSINSRIDRRFDELENKMKERE